MNKILELRLLKTNKLNPKSLPDLFVPLEKLRKQNDKLKEALSSTRKDRQKQKLKTGTVSILDLAAAFDKERKIKLEKKEKQLLENEKEFLKNRLPVGNKDDTDAR